jgi:hypothetical protein
LLVVFLTISRLDQLSPAPAEAQSDA